MLELLLELAAGPHQLPANFQFPAGEVGRAYFSPSCWRGFSFGSLQHRSLASLGQALDKKGVSSWAWLGSGGRHRSAGVGGVERRGILSSAAFNPFNPYPGLVSGLPCRHHFRSLVIETPSPAGLPSRSGALPEGNRSAAILTALRVYTHPQRPSLLDSLPLPTYRGVGLLISSNPRSFPSALLLALAPPSPTGILNTHNSPSLDT
ncbi:hypothetical protein QBC34DRAFT_215950 [Podospora aff. communis PSN243]|uniref:Uncharacterized protein n=1 Tax=Podospora aff. communis PSN243 TaxID=3040156 RepID=A0AAV9GYM8_9PEZI|nr:hypothetical protein QBC34DRAFT_215950 [Podospora aff. communis PSN243]